MSLEDSTNVNFLQNLIVLILNELQMSQQVLNINIRLLLRGTNLRHPLNSLLVHRRQNFSSSNRLVKLTSRHERIQNLRSFSGAHCDADIVVVFRIHGARHPGLALVVGDGPLVCRHYLVLGGMLGS